MKYLAKVKSVASGSIAEEAGIEKGDIIAKVNGEKIEDELDFRFYAASDFVELEVIKCDESIEVIEIEEPDTPDLGIEFESALFGGAKSCANKCIFCFIDQLPKGMRDTLYFKDDDSRLSFLTGNYVTLTNASDKDIDKIIKMRLDPVNVSVHTTNPKLREFMLKNKRAGKLMYFMKRLADAGIHMNCQIVLVKGVNDGAELERTINDLSELYPYVTSVSAVPVGITKYRDGLYPLEPYTKEECKEVIAEITKKQQEFLNKMGTRFIYAADEFYVKSDTPIPPEEEYEGYYQIENGVGLLRSMENEFMEALLPSDVKRTVSIATGYASYKTISKLADEAMKVCKNLKILVYPIENVFFGENITVSGLLTGQDIINQLKDKELGEELLISESALKHESDLFLDDTKLCEIEKSLGVKVKATACFGEAFLNALLGGVQ